MQLEKQVCSLELAKKLKELGVKQESHFRWYHASLIPWNVVTSHGFSNEEARERSPSAFTVAELGELLGSNFETFFGGRLWYVTMAASGKQWEAETEADARANALIYLLENKLISNE